MSYKDEPFYYGFDGFEHQTPLDDPNVLKEEADALEQPKLYENVRGVNRLRNPVVFLGRFDWILLIVIFAALSSGYVFLTANRPQAVSPHMLRDFSEERVVKFLHQLSKDGDLDVALFLDKLNLISSITESHYINVFELFIHNTLSCIGTDEECFKRSGNVAALIGPRDREPDNTILVGCEFTLEKNRFNETSPIPCAMLVDVLQALILSNSSFSNDIIFAFNLKGDGYTEDPFQFLMETYDVNAFIRLSGSNGQEVLLAGDRPELKSMFLDVATRRPSNVMLEHFYASQTKARSILSNVSESDKRFNLDVFYPPGKVSLLESFNHKGRLQSSGDNMFAFLKALSTLEHIHRYELSIFGFTINLHANYTAHGFYGLRLPAFAFTDIRDYAVIGFVSVVLLAGAAALFIFTALRRKLSPKKLTVYYFGTLGSIIALNIAIYLFNDLFNYIPCIDWTPSLIFVRNTAVHSVVTISLFLKLAEGIDPKLRIDYEHLYFTFGMYIPLLVLSIVMYLTLSYAWGYLLFIAIIPMTLNVVCMRQLLLGFGLTFSSPRSTMCIQIMSLIPATIFLADTVYTYYRALQYGCEQPYGQAAAIIGFFVAFLVSNLTWCSQNIICDWGANKYIPRRDCDWLKVENDDYSYTHEEMLQI
uniref:SSD domain-containing protein n=1 Tax=Panagrellus redivivus TaxID=6233 RepID=A0A7E5A088_PANRE